LHTYYRTDLNLSRPVVLNFWLTLLIYTNLWRFIYHKYRQSKGSLKHRAVVIGIPEESSELAKSLEAYSQLGHTVLGFIHPHVRNQHSSPSKETQTNIVGGIDTLESFVKDQDVHDIIIIANLTPSSLLEIIDSCQRTPCRVWIYPSLYEVMIGRLQIQEIAGLPLIEVDPYPLSGWYGFAKRTMDIIASGIGLLLAIPIMLIVIPIVKMDSPGPVFYTQKRLGKGNKIFQLSKFRTMRQDAEKNTGAVWAQANDPRITRVGKFMRKTRLDEIPQLFNVLKGDMSLIGPRPERPELMEKFTLTSPHFHRRLAIRPGLTGLAQIQGRYDLDIDSKLRYDLAYIYNVNLLLDVKILLATVKVVFTGKGAM
jgi:exopolysaccharide biosynthesis polyprenyl glycosylphosphotransferase